MRFYVRAVSYYLPDWPLVCVWVCLIGASTAVGLLAAWPMALLIDSVLDSPVKDDWIHHLFLSFLSHNRMGRLISLAAAGFAVKLVQDLLGAVQAVVCNHINYNGLMRIRCDLYRKLQAMSMAYHKSQPQGDVIYRLNSDTFGCQAILGILVSAMVACGTIIVMLCILSTRSPSLTLSVFAITPFLAAANIFFGRRFRVRSLECKERDSQLTTAVQRSMSCIGLVQAFGREAQEFSQFRGSVRETIRAGWGLNREQVVYNLLVGTLFGLGGAVVFGYGGYLVYRGALSLGELIVFTSYLGLVWGPLCTLTGFYANIQQGVASAQRVFEILDRDQVIRDVVHARPLPCQPRVLELDNVGFSYAPTGLRPVLDQVSARIEPGQMVAFVGSSGVGKSTLLNLLPRFYDPTAGALRLDGIDAREVRLADLRRHVALVVQDSVILPSTIAENIAYGRPGATPEQIHEAARMAGAADFIAALPQGYDTPMAEGGQSMSGGQRQRIAIARALLTDAPIVVLDEPTSALDPLHERLVIEALRNLKRKRTIILVSHRLSTVRDCDQIFVIERGRVAERGTHEQLVASGGIYAAMAGEELSMTPDGLSTAA